VYPRGGARRLAFTVRKEERRRNFMDLYAPDIGLAATIVLLVLVATVLL